jgi:hypothetical protein
MTTDIARDEAVPPRESMASEVRRVAAAATLPHRYVVRGDALEFGAGLGNAHCWRLGAGSRDRQTDQPRAPLDHRGDT